MTVNFFFKSLKLHKLFLQSSTYFDWNKSTLLVTSHIPMRIKILKQKFWLMSRLLFEAHMCHNITTKFFPQKIFFVSKHHDPMWEKQSTCNVRSKKKSSPTMIKSANVCYPLSFSRSCEEKKTKQQQMSLKTKKFLRTYARYKFSFLSIKSLTRCWILKFKFPYVYARQMHPASKKKKHRKKAKR